ncbi:hypothetical protein V1502_12015 [Bacillus sp. SCS-153A]|uniref:hypothetical protein n=1 Tax=Rossellomorea sedimentorum TaxID=3115294 RepID=UPI003906218C
MELFIFGGLLFILFLYILYSIIEAGVRRGIDNSETGQIIRRMIKDQMEKPLSPPSDEEIEKELERQLKEKDY